MNILILLTHTVSCNVETFELAKGMVESGADVSLILSSHVENLERWESARQDFKEIYYVDTHTSKKNFFQKTAKFIWSGRKKLKRAFKNKHYDFIINTMANYWDVMISSLIDADEIVCFIHDPLSHSGMSLRGKILERCMYKRADQVVVHTKSFIPVVQNKYGFPTDKIHHSPHCRLKAYKLGNIQANKDPFYSGKINYLFFGYIREYKGLHILAKAYKTLAVDRNLPVTLTIAGSGDFNPYRNEYASLPNVRIINRRIKDEEIEKLFSAPQCVVVLPYLDATQSGVIVTALEFGAPIIATDTGGLKEQLQDGKIGLFCKPGDADSLSEQMLHMLQCPEEFEKQHKLMSKYLHKLDPNVIAKDLLDMLYRKNVLPDDSK